MCRGMHLSRAMAVLGSWKVLDTGPMLRSHSASERISPTAFRRRDPFLAFGMNHDHKDINLNALYSVDKDYLNITDSCGSTCSLLELPMLCSLVVRYYL